MPPPPVPTGLHTPVSNLAPSEATVTEEIRFAG